MNPTLSSIWVYPIKALDPVALPEATIAPGGSLSYDREFAILDPQGRWVNGKTNPKVHTLRARYDLPQRQVTLTSAQQRGTFHLDQERPQLEAWLSTHFGMPVHLGQNLAIGNPDDPRAWGPTVISTATLEAVAAWFPGLDTDNLRRRIRANLELTGVPAFWEDRLFGSAAPFPFSLGSVEFQGINPCARCIVPTRDPWTGVAYPHFQRIFNAQRRATLPPEVVFDHFYRLSINTRIDPSQAGKTLRLGDPCLS